MPLALGDLVLRKVVETTKNPSWGKLGPNWEGSHHITSVASIGAYFLKDLDENVVLRPQNVNDLRRYYYKKAELPSFGLITIVKVLRGLVKC